MLVQLAQGDNGTQKDRRNGLGLCCVASRNLPAVLELPTTTYFLPPIDRGKMQ